MSESAQPPPPSSSQSSARPAERSPRRGMCAAVLSLEAITLGLTTPVMITISDVSTGPALAVGLGLMVACLVVAGMLRAEWGYQLGWLLQAWAIGLGLVVPIMFVLGPVFALLWGTAYFLGRKIERERAAAWAAYEAGEGPHPGTPDDDPEPVS